MVKKKQSLFKVVEPYLYLIPCLLIFIIFVYFPFFKTIYLSLFNTSPKGKATLFVGLGNYIAIFKSPDFFNSLMVTFKFVILVVIPSIIIGLLTATLANTKLKGSGTFKVMYALPMAVSSACAAIVWMMLFHPSIGYLNYILKTDIGWLTDEKWALVAVSAVTVWMNIGMNFIFVLSGLQGISKDLYESASIDGANFLHQFINITIPGLSPTLFFLLIVDIINAFQAFGQVNIMTTGGPGDSTKVLVFAIYRDAFFNNRFGMASAESVVLFAIMLVLTLIQFKYEKRSVFYK